MAEQRATREAACDARGNVDHARMEMQMLVHGLVEPRLSAEQAADLMDKAAGPGWRWCWGGCCSSRGSIPLGRYPRWRWRRPRKGFARNELEGYHFALAERLGMTVARLEREMGTKELAQWITYDRYRAGR